MPDKKHSLGNVWKLGAESEYYSVLGFKVFDVPSFFLRAIWRTVKHHLCSYNNLRYTFSPDGFFFCFFYGSMNNYLFACLRKREGCLSKSIYEFETLSEVFWDENRWWMHYSRVMHPQVIYERHFVSTDVNKEPLVSWGDLVNFKYKFYSLSVRLWRAIKFTYANQRLNELHKFWW